MEKAKRTTFIPTTTEKEEESEDRGRETETEDREMVRRESGGYNEV